MKQQLQHIALSAEIETDAPSYDEVQSSLSALSAMIVDKIDGDIEDILQQSY